MIFEVITIFPECFPGVLGIGNLGKALQKGLFKINVHNPRNFTHDKHRTVDDSPYGGGPGMVMKPEPIFECLESLGAPKPLRILLSPQGQKWSHQLARKIFKKYSRIALVCGRYEGVDERIREFAVDLDISLGDYVLSGGEVAAMTVIETLSRFIPGVVGDPVSVDSDSFTKSLFKFPQYTRPVDYRGMKVPEILVSGNHQKIEEWRIQKALERTQEKRPDLFSCKLHQKDDSNSIDVDA
ncbi:tRNA (guanosine(37)-N1)-methyltransferase TrmD [bacterium]|nr:tRNA (guanosine(37)-N1)-methyltransferase TrmD [candidate division CSSED10-310 bacterium]